MSQTRAYSRASEPDLQSLADTIRSHMTTAATGSFYLAWNGQSVVVEAADLSRVNDATIQAAVNACAVPSELADVKRYIDTMPLAERANYLVILDQVNLIRSKLPTPLAAITVQQYLAAVKTKAETLAP